MKKLIILAVLAALFLSACGKPAEETTVPATTEATTEVTTEATTEAATEATTEAATEATTEAATEATTEATEAEEWVAPEISQNSRKLDTPLETKLFTLSIPSYWNRFAICRVEDYAVIFRETYSYQKGYGGKICSVQALPQDVDYTQWPETRLMGTIIDSEGNAWNLVVIYPSDVQFDLAAQSLYDLMMEDCARVLDSLRVIDGYSFVPA